MRLLSRVDPRWAVPLLVPVLLAAGAVQPPPAAVRSAVAVAPRPVVLTLTVDEPATTVAPQLLAPVPVDVAPRRLRDGDDRPRARVRAARSSTRRLGPTTAEQRGRAALATLPYDTGALGYRIVFVPYRGGGVLGTTNRQTRLITVHVRRGQSELSLRTTLAHELGHALDFEHGTRERRDAYRRIRALPDVPWFPCDRCDDLSSPAGDFAEVFAVWLAGPGDFRSRLQRPPDRAQLRELDGLFRVPREPVRAAARSPEPEPRPTERPGSGLPDLLAPGPSPSPTRG